MLNGGEIVLDVSGEDKQALTPAKLITMFESY